MSTTAASGGVAASTIPQFEPVSPDDGDHTPPLVTMEGITSNKLKFVVISGLFASVVVYPGIKISIVASLLVI